VNKPQSETVKSQRVELDTADLEAACRIPAGTMEIATVTLDRTTSPATVTVTWTHLSSAPPVTT